MDGGASVMGLEVNNSNNNSNILHLMSTYCVLGIVLRVLPTQHYLFLTTAIISRMLQKRKPILRELK